jgi:hypothetical protein
MSFSLLPYGGTESMADMGNQDLYLQIGGIVWVIGGSLFLYKKADWFVAMNARMGKQTNRDTARRFSLFTLTLGVLGALILGFTTTVEFLRK